MQKLRRNFVGIMEKCLILICVCFCYINRKWWSSVYSWLDMLIYPVIVEASCSIISYWTFFMFEDFSFIFEKYWTFSRCGATLACEVGSVVGWTDFCFSFQDTTVIIYRLSWWFDASGFWSTTVLTKPSFCKIWFYMWFFTAVTIRIYYCLMTPSSCSEDHTATGRSSFY